MDNRTHSWRFPSVFIGLLTGLSLVAAACGPSAPTQPAASSAPATQAPAKPAATAAAPAQATAAPAAAPTTAPTTVPAGSTQAPITLKFAHQFQTTHFINKLGVEVWMQRVTELTGEKVKFEHYPAEQLGKRADQVKLIKGGVTEIAGVPPTSFPGEFPLSAVGALPGLYKTSAAGTKAYNALLKQGPLKAEYDQHALTPLFYFAPAMYEIHSTKKQILTMEDLKGLKVRTLGGPQVQAVEAVAAVAVQTPAADLFVALQRGTVDAALFPFTSVKEYKLEELVKFSTFGAPFTPGMTGFSIRTDVWNKLAPETREVMTKVNQEVTDRLVKYSDDEVEQFIKQFEGLGIKVQRLSADEQARWEKVLTPVVEAWDKQMAGKGLPGKEVREAFVKATK